MGSRITNKLSVVSKKAFVQHWFTVQRQLLDVSQVTLQNLTFLTHLPFFLACVPYDTFSIMLNNMF